MAKIDVTFARCFGVRGRPDSLILGFKLNSVFMLEPGVTSGEGCQCQWDEETASEQPEATKMAD